MLKGHEGRKKGVGLGEGTFNGEVLGLGRGVREE
jgi:hypothetical protein